MDINPYQAPPITSEPIGMASVAEPVAYGFVDGKALVVSSGAVLPLICNKTNQPVSMEDMKTQTMIWHRTIAAVK